MNFTNKLCLCIAILSSLSSFSMMRQLIHDENRFRVIDGNREQVVQPCFVDPLLKRMSPEQFATFIEQGNRVKAIRLSNGEQRLQAMVPGKGGGPISGLIAYTLTKSLGYALTAGVCVPAVVVAPGTIVVGVPTAIVAGSAISETAALSTGAIFASIPFLP